MIKLDSTKHSTVILCTRCHWRQVTPGTGHRDTDRARAWAVGAGHEAGVHGGRSEAAAVARRAAQRLNA